MSLSKNAINLLHYLTPRFGRQIGETAIRTTLGVSHGTFIAARRELVERKLITVRQGGGNRSPIYSAAVQAAPPISAASAASAAKSAELLTVTGEMTRVAGLFDTFDDWVDELTAALGSVDVDDNGDGTYNVCARDLDRRDTYRISTEGAGILVY